MRPPTTPPDPADSNKTVTVYGSTMFNWTQTFCMLIGRYFEIIPVMALAGALAEKKAVPMHTGSFPVVGPTFCLLVAAVIIIVGALELPARPGDGPGDRALQDGRIALLTSN